MRDFSNWVGCDSLAYVIVKCCLGLKEGRSYDLNCFLLAPKGAVFATVCNRCKMFTGRKLVHTVLNTTSAAASLSSLRLGKSPTACAILPLIRATFSFECGSAYGQQQVASAPPRVELPDEVTQLTHKTPTRFGRWHVCPRRCASPLCHCLFE